MTSQPATVQQPPAPNGQLAPTNSLSHAPSPSHSPSRLPKGGAKPRSLVRIETFEAEVTQRALAPYDQTGAVRHRRRGKFVGPNRDGRVIEPG